MKRTNLWFLLGLLAILPIFNACMTEDGGDKASFTIMPLSVGNYWEYNDSVYSSTGSFSSVTTRRTSIDGKIQIQYQGKSSEVFLEHIGSKPDSGYWLLANEANGLYIHGGKSGDSLFLRGKYLVMDSAGWRVTPYTESHGEFSFSTSASMQPVLLPWVSKDSTYTTPAGAFHCYASVLQIVLFGDTSSVTQFWALNKGLVASIYRNKGKITEKTILTSYVAN